MHRNDPFSPGTLFLRDILEARSVQIERILHRKESVRGFTRRTQEPGLEICLGLPFCDVFSSVSVQEPCTCAPFQLARVRAYELIDTRIATRVRSDEHTCSLDQINREDCDTGARVHRRIGSVMDR